MSTARTGITLFALLWFVCQVMGTTWAQSYPAKPVRLIVPTSAGSGTDTIGRIIAAGLADTLGQQVIVENRAGASGNIGAEVAARAPADGYSLLLGNIAYAANATLFPKLSYDFVRDFAPVTQLATSPGLIVIHPSLPVRSIGEFVKLAKAKPEAIDFSSGGSGTAMYLATEMFNHQAAVKLRHVPFRSGSEALMAVVAGHIPVHFAPLATAMPQVKAGRVRALAVTSTKRVPALPDTPTVNESGLPGYEFGNWYGLLVPAKTSRETITTIRGAAISALNNPGVNKRMVDLGYLIIGDQPEEFAAHIKSEIGKLARLIKALDLKPE